MSEIYPRSMLFVPASNRRMIEKAAASAADAVCLDLEDSVPVPEKAAARGIAATALREIDFGERLRILRINALDTAFAYRDLIETLEPAGDRIDLVMLPKASAPRDVQFVETLLAQIEASSAWSRRQIGIEAQIETAAGFLYAREIAQATPRLRALIFGPGDFSASMQMPAVSIGEPDKYDSEYPGHRWHSVMHTIVAAARANGLRAVDGPFAAYRDGAGFERSCCVARAIGFDGKQCIHPGQLAAANRIFSPSEAEIEHARRILEAYDRAAAEGRGAVGYDGRMIDAANLRMARVVLERSGRNRPN